MIKKLKVPYCGHMFLVILMVKKLLEHFVKINEKEFRVEKVIKRKGDKLYVRWEGYDNSINGLTNKKDIA